MYSEQTAPDYIKSHKTNYKYVCTGSANNENSY